MISKKIYDFYINHTKKIIFCISSIVISTIYVFFFGNYFDKIKYEEVNFNYKSNQTIFNGELDIHLFIDYANPESKELFENLIRINNEIPNKIKINIYHYPVDITCNSNAKEKSNTYSCTAALMSICSEKDELSISKYLFGNQKKFSNDFFNSFIKTMEVSFECFQDEDVKEYIISSIELGGMSGLTKPNAIIMNNKKYLNENLTYDKLYMLIKQSSSK